MRIAYNDDLVMVGLDYEPVEAKPDKIVFEEMAAIKDPREQSGVYLKHRQRRFFSLGN